MVNLLDAIEETRLLLLHQTTTTGFSGQFLIDFDLSGLLLSTRFREGDREDAILHVCLDIFRLSKVGISVTPFKLTTEVIESCSPSYQVGAVATLRTCHSSSRGWYNPCPFSRATTGSHWRWKGGRSERPCGHLPWTSQANQMWQSRC